MNRTAFKLLLWDRSVIGSLISELPTQNYNNGFSTLEPDGIVTISVSFAMISKASQTEAFKLKIDSGQKILKLPEFNLATADLFFDGK